MKLLRIRSVDADESFFDLGGDSLLAIQLLARIHRQWGVRPAVKDVFAHPTLRQLSAFLDGFPAEEGTRENALSAPGTAAEALLSFAQQRLWVVHQLHDLGGTYNVPVVLRVTGPLNLPVLQRSLEALVQRHQALRTSFSYVDGRLVQRVGAAFPLPIPVIELPNSDINSAETERWLSAEGHQSFDLERAPLLRVRAARLGAQDHVVLLVVHHLIFDGWSVRVLASELSALYNHARRGQPAPLPDLSMQYPDYARWQAEQQALTALATALSYWKNRLRGAPPLLALPTDYPRPEVQTFAGDDVAFTLPPATWEALTRLAVPATTPFMRLLAATAVWLGRQASTDDVVIGVPIAGRTRAEANALIGFFVNTLVIRVELSGNLTFRQLLQRVRQRAMEAYEHQELPFDQLVGTLNPPRTLAYTPLVQVVVDFDEEATDAWQLDGVHTEQLPFRQHTAKFDLNVSFRQTKRGLEGVFNYKSDLFKRETVVRWSEEFTRLVEELAREPDRPLTPGTPISAERTSYPANAPENAAAAREEAPPPATKSPDVAPVLAALRALWIRLLGLDTVRLDDNFFDLGGHSLLAFQLGAEWQRQTGQKLPLTLLFAYPTLGQLAEQVTRLPLTSPALVPIRPQSAGNALFFVHDVSGDVDYARQLAPYLPDEWSVFGLEAPGLHGESVPVSTIEEMATQHLKRIIAHQPEGPYALGGYSLGGIIAFEMARQLRQAGQQIQLLALLDCYPLTPQQSSLKRVPLRYVLHNYWNFWRTVPKHPTALGNVVRKKVPALVRYLGNRARQFVKPAPPLSIEEQIGPEMAAFYAVNPLVEAHIDAYNRYVFRPCDVKAVFMRATSELVYGNLTKHLKNFDFGWSRYARGGVEVHEMPGTHASLFKDPEALSRMGALLKRSQKHP